MIVTLTPNPSLDLLFTADRLVWEDANRIPMPRRRPGGQGINVVRAVRALDPGAAAVAVTPLGGPVGRDMAVLLEAEGTPLRAIRIAGETRVFVGVRERETGRSLLLNPRGPEAGPGEADAILDALAAALDDAPAADPGDDRWLACCGSLLPGLPADFYARAGDLARARGFRVVPDCDGEPLAAAVAAGCDLLVPNEHEASRLLGREVAGPEAAIAAARELVGRGPHIVAVTLGGAGAVMASATGAWRARLELPPGPAARAAAGSAVGAGDAFLAALLLGLRSGQDEASVLARAVAAGTAVLLGSGVALVEREVVAEVGGWVRTASFEL